MYNYCPLNITQTVKQKTRTILEKVGFVELCPQFGATEVNLCFIAFERLQGWVKAMLSTSVTLFLLLHMPYAVLQAQVAP